MPARVCNPVLQAQQVTGDHSHHQVTLSSPPHLGQVYLLIVCTVYAETLQVYMYEDRHRWMLALGMQPSPKIQLTTW